MTRTRLLMSLGLALILLLLGVGAGVWWYLFGANKVEAAELVPTDTLVFATIPNGVSIAAGYETSQLKTLVDSPNTKPLTDQITALVGQKTIDLLTTFAPCLSGQSFFALTHLDTDKPNETGFIAAMKPKTGTASFDAFVEKLKAALPDQMKQVTTGTGTVAGVDYQWIKGNDEPIKVCVANVNGWIVTTAGEAGLQDWIERYQKKSTTPSLAQNADYQKSLSRVGQAPMTLLYVNTHALFGILQKVIPKTSPAQTEALSKVLDTYGGITIGTRFENGEIIDRFSFLVPQQTIIDSGVGATPCPFDSLHFTGPDTRLYWATSIDFKQYWKNLQTTAGAGNPMVTQGFKTLADSAAAVGIDLQHNVIDPLGSEVSLQMDWSADATYPDAGLFIKLDKPDDFKPTITAIINEAQKSFANSAVLTQLNSGGHNFTALKFVQSSPFSPTITTDGPWLGLFVTETHAVRAFQRDDSLGLLHNDDFNRQVGDKRNGASTLAFFDTPKVINQSYKTAMPYVSLLSMFNAKLAGLIKGKTLPDDLTWLAPIGTWSYVMTTTPDGVQGYSVSGVGNQGILFGSFLGVGAGTAQMMGLIPGAAKIHPVTAPANPPALSGTNAPAATPPAPADDTTTNAPAALAPAPTAPITTTPAPDTSGAPASAPASTPSPDASATTNTTPNATSPQ